MQAVWAEAKSVGSGLQFGEPAGWSAFQGLQTNGMLVAEGLRASARVSAKRQPLVLAVAQDDIEQGLQLAGITSGSLHDALCGVAGMQRVEASRV